MDAGGRQRLLGRLALAAGEATEAERYVHDALGRLVAKSFVLDIPECLDVLAAVAATQESFEEAARLLGAAAAGRKRLGIVRFPPEPEFWARVERLTKRQIDERMFISPGTVKIHLSHVFAKLDTPSRSHLAAEATRRKLDPPTATDATTR